jgi:transposase-like protein
METFLFLKSEEVDYMQGNRWASDDRIRIVMESLTTNIAVAELCRKYNLKPNVFYSWKQKFIESGKLALAGSSENINKELHAENERLKKLIGELTIANDVLNKATIKQN